MTNHQETRTNIEPKVIAQVLQDFAAELMKHSTGDMLHLMRRAELSMPQLVTLMFLHRHGPASLGHIRAHLGLTLGATSHLVDRLVDAQFVSRREDPQDRRQKQIALSDAGQVLVADAKRARVEDMARQLAHLPAPLLERLINSMTEIASYLRTADAQPDQSIPTNN